MIEKLEPIDGKEVRELRFGYGDMAVISRINFSASKKVKPKGEITVLQTDTRAEIGKQFPNGTQVKKVNGEVSFPIDGDGAISLLCFLGQMEEDDEDKVFTLNFQDGIVKFNFEKFNDKSREVVFNAISEMGAILSILEKREPYTLENYRNGRG